MPCYNDTKDKEHAQLGAWLCKVCQYLTPLQMKEFKSEYFNDSYMAKIENLWDWYIDHCEKDKE